MRGRGSTVGIAGSLLLTGCASMPAQDCAALPGVSRQFVVVERSFAPVYRYADDASKVAHLTCLAGQSHQDAQLALAQIYESGDGAEQDLALAAEWYARAAQGVPFKTAIYSPPVRLGGAGQVLLLDNPGGRHPSSEALYRLGRMYWDGRGVPVDRRQGVKLIDKAADVGYAPAIEWLTARSAQEVDQARKSR